jgi:hypothetical protein
MATKAHTHDQFQQALFSSGLKRYSWSPYGETDYYPSWLAPDGRIITGDSHERIALDTVGGGYGQMYEAGYLRLAPGYRQDHLTIEGHATTTHITPEQRVTLSKLLRTFKPSKANNHSYVSVDGSGTATVVHSAKEFLLACLDAYGSAA